MRYKPTSEQIISAIEYRTGIHPSKDFAETLRCRSEIPSLYIHPWFDRKGCKISMWKLVKYVNYKHERDEQFPKDIGRIFDTIINASKDIFEKFPSKGQTWWDEWATGTYSFNPDILHISYRDATKTRQVLNSELKKQFDIERKEIIKINIEKGHHKGYWILCTTFEEELYNYVVEEAPKAVLDIFTLVDCSLCNTEHPDIDYTNRGYGEIIDRILDKISPF
ncbi:MAG: hypothetical protein U9P44_04295, partial [archaeon]|nr:hypothetical protein [archaeon]